MKRLKYIVIPMLCLAVTSCGHQKNKDTESLVETQGSTQTEPFNLAKLKAGQNINDILNLPEQQQKKLSVPVKLP